MIEVKDDAKKVLMLFGNSNLILYLVMRDAGFEPALLAWEANVLTTRPIPQL